MAARPLELGDTAWIVGGNKTLTCGSVSAVVGDEHLVVRIQCVIHIEHRVLARSQVFRTAEEAALQAIAQNQPPPTIPQPQPLKWG